MAGTYENEAKVMQGWSKKFGGKWVKRIRRQTALTYFGAVCCGVDITSAPNILAVRAAN
jgi:hypothetical protein